MQSVHKFLVFLLIAVLATTFIVAGVAVYAKDWGRIGQTYPIKEIDLLEFIQARLQHMQQSGELEQKNQQMLKTINARSERLNQSQGYSPTNKPRSWLIDPSVALKSDVLDVEGRVVVKSGTKVNPLNHAPLRSTLIFYDGDNKAQRAWAMKHDKLLQGKTKLILVNGSVTEQINIFKKRVFFDQHGILVNKLKIKHTPALAIQEGLQIRVEEVLP